VRISHGAPATKTRRPLALTASCTSQSPITYSSAAKTGAFNKRTTAPRARGHGCNGTGRCAAAAGASGLPIQNKLVSSPSEQRRTMDTITPRRETARRWRRLPLAVLYSYIPYIPRSIPRVYYIAVCGAVYFY